MAHVAEYKKRIVKDIVNLINQYPIIGAVNMENLPAPQLQKMRAHLRDKIEFSMTKKRLMKIALEQAKNSKKDIEKLKEHLTGMPALIFTEENPFKLFRILKKNKSPAPAKAGQIAPNDIIVPAGPTSFAPGPIIGELAQIGIKSGVEGGKVAIKKDSVVAKKGEKIKPKVAEILTRLGIQPMEVGLDLVATYEDGTIYSKDVLDIDEDKFMADLKKSANLAFNLAIFAAYPTKDTIEHLISKAFNDSKALGLSQNIIDEGIIDSLLAKAQRQMLSLSSIAKIEVKEEPKAEKPEVKEEPEVKKEEKKEVPAPKVEEEPKKKAEEKKIEEEKKKIEEEKRKAEELRKKQEEAKKAEEERKELEEKKKQEELRRQEERKKAEEEAKKQEELRKQEEAKKESERKRLEEEKKKAEAKRKQEEARKAEEEQKRKELEEKKKLEEQKRAEEEKRKAEESRRQEEEKRREEERKRQEELKRQEERRKQEELKKLEEERERAEEQKKKEEEIDIKVREMVEKTKKMAEGPGPTAADILEEVEREVKPVKKEKKEPEKKKEIDKEHPEAQRLVQELQRKGTLRGVRAEEIEKKKPEAKKESKEDEQKKVEELFNQLKKKGTLRK